MVWQIFILSYRDYDNYETTRGAAEFPDSLRKYTLMVLAICILHITTTAKELKPLINKKRQIVKLALNFLAGKHIKE